MVPSEGPMTTDRGEWGLEQRLPFQILKSDKIKNSYQIFMPTIHREVSQLIVLYFKSF
jgi:hypothetical protein